MGCECSEQKKEEHLIAEAAAKNGQAPMKKPLLGDKNEHIQQTPKLTWYHEVELLQDGDIMTQLSTLIGEHNKADIEHALKSAHIKDSIHSVCQFMINEKATAIKEEVVKDKKPLETSPAFVRLMLVLGVYVEWLTSSKKKNIYELMNDGKLGGKAKGQQITLQQILDDYLELLSSYNTDEDFQLIHQKLASKKLILSLDSWSSILSRVYRDRSKMPDKLRKKIFFGYTDSREITAIQLLDRIYVHYAYSYQLGLRLTMKEKLQILYAKPGKDGKEELKEAEDSDDQESAKGDLPKDAKLVCMQSLIRRKQINLLNVVGKKRLGMNKFVTLSPSTDSVVYFYKETEAKSEEYINIEGNKEYKTKHWFVAPKYKDLKHEVLNNEKAHIVVQQWNDLTLLAKLHANAQHLSKLRKRAQDNHRGEAWKMDESHLLALMLYSNFAFVQAELKETYFRRLDENDAELQKRHSVFAHLGRLLKEAVVEYGEAIDQKSRVRMFYHSYSLDSVSRSLIKFGAPTSTSSSKVVLYNYGLSTHGTIMELDSGFLDLEQGDKPSYFDMAWLSDMSVEDEKLFIAQLNPLELSNIQNIRSNQNYQLFVIAFNIITTIFGEINESWGKEKKPPFHVLPKQHKLKKLVQKVLERQASVVQPHLFGKKKKHKEATADKQVLLRLLQQFSAAKREMTLFWFSAQTGELWPWMQELLTFMKESVFCKPLKSDFMWVKLDLLALMFVNMHTLNIVDCPINEGMLQEIDAFLRKLQLDPNEKFNKKNKEEEAIPDADALNKDESVIDNLLGVDIDGLIGDLKSDKSHISFKDPNFDDLCDYRGCAIHKIAILESYDQGGFKSVVDSKMIRKYNKKFAKSGWEMTVDKIMGNDGYVIRKINNALPK